MNAVEQAVQAVSGPTKASHICRVSYKAICNWRERGIVPNGRKAFLLAEAAQAAGCKVTAAQLVGFENGKTAT